MARWMRLLGLLLLAWLLAFHVDRHQLASLLASAHLFPLTLAIALNLPVLFLKSERWRLLLRAQGIRYRSGAALKAFTASQYVGILTPGRVGDLTRVVYLRHDLAVPLAAGAASVLVDRLLDVYFLVAVGLCACVRFGLGLTPVRLVAIALVTLAPLLLFVPRILERILRARLARRLLARLAGGGEEERARATLDLQDALRALVSRRLLPAFGLTILGYLGTFLQWGLLARALRLPVHPLDLALMAVLANLVALLPLSIAGLGTRDATVRALFTRLGLPPAAGIALSLAVLAAAWLVMALAGFVAFELWPPPSRPRLAAVSPASSAAAGGTVP